MTSLVEAFYGLKKPPFSTSESSGPVLMTEPLRAAASFVRRELARRVSILAVTGAAGIGKSSLVRGLSKLTGGEWRIALMSGRARCWDDLRQVLAREFEIGAGRVTRAELESAHAKHGKLLIVVDDAEQLSPELLERICILPQLRTANDQPVVHVILFADLGEQYGEQVRPLLAWIDAEAHHVMNPLPLGDAHRYLDTLMRRAGWLGAPLFSEAGAGAVHRASLGNPRRISETCIDVLERASARGLSRVDAEFVVECSSLAEPQADRLLSASTGTAVLGEALGERLREPAINLDDEDWELALETAPLTAENIAAAPSLQLAAVERGASGERTVAPPLHSIRAVARPPKQARPIPPRTQSRRRPLVVAMCALAATAVLYASRTEVADLLQELGVNLPFVEKVVKGHELDGEAKAAASSKQLDTEATAMAPLGEIEAVDATSPPVAAEPAATTDLALY